MKKHAVALLVLALCITGTVQTRPAGAAPPADLAQPAPIEDAVIAWNMTAADATIASGITPLLNPLHESRLLAMVHIAIHDALNAIERRSEPYALDIGLFPDASRDAAVAAAAHDVLVAGLSEIPVPPFDPEHIADAVTLVEERYQAAIAAIPETTLLERRAKRQGMAIGHASAAFILALRADDGADEEFLAFDYPEGTAPGEFRFVEGLPFAAAPLWGEVTPFVLRHGAQYRPRPPYRITSKKYAADFNELKRLGGQPTDLTPTERTSEQTATAFFWFESSPLRWNQIARTVSASAGLDLWGNARLFGLLNMALADGYIGNWDAKYHYNRWRPETAVRLADDDGNPRTAGDPDWTPAWRSSGATPEYDSGHAIEGAAAAAVFQRVFGTDEMTFEVCSHTIELEVNRCTGAEPTLRTYTSFSQASEENGVSRIYLGWHFRHSVEQGFRHGERIANRAVNRFMRPIH